jgi:hypothetical protein
MWWNASNRQTRSKAFSGRALASGLEPEIGQPSAYHLVGLGDGGSVDIEADEPRRGEPSGEDTQSVPPPGPTSATSTPLSSAAWVR